MKNVIRYLVPIAAVAIVACIALIVMAHWNRYANQPRQNRIDAVYFETDPRGRAPIRHVEIESSDLDAFRSALLADLNTYSRSFDLRVEWSYCILVVRDGNEERRFAVFPGPMLYESKTRRGWQTRDAGQLIEKYLTKIMKQQYGDGKNEDQKSDRDQKK